jgi:proline iminopeptidase
MKSRIRRTIACLFLLCTAVFAWLMFVPRHYDVPEWQASPDFQYWNLSTGSRIGYKFLAGASSKKPYPIIFLQGGPGGFISRRNIDMLAPLAAHGYDVYLYDPVGSGHSARLADLRQYTAIRHKQDLEAIVKTIGADKVILIGQSWGAILATLFIADAPQRVAKVIFTGPGPIQPQRPELASVPAPDSLQLRAPLYTNSMANSELANLRMKAVKQWAAWFGKKLASDAEADAFQTSLNLSLSKSTVCDTAKALKVPTPGGGYYAQIMTVESFSGMPDPRPKLQAADMPVLIMKGQCDNQKWGYTAEYLRLLKHHRLVIIPGAGHSISAEQPKLYLQTILSFLDE